MGTWHEVWHVPRDRWLIGLVWATWFFLTGAVGDARRTAADRVDDRGTRVWADVATTAAMLGAVAAARSLPGATIPGPPRRTAAFGSALVLCGIVLRRWAGRSLGRFFTHSVTIREGHRVVSSGPYRFVRHPGYAGLLVSLVGLAVTLRNWLSVLLMVLGFWAGHLPRMRVEEHVLEENLGEAYRAFEATRSRLIPGIY